LYGVPKILYILWLTLFLTKIKRLNINWDEYLDDEDLEIFRKHERTGRPLGDEDFVSKLEKICKRELAKKKTGPKKR
jgi:putative transposase